MMDRTLAAAGFALCEPIEHFESSQGIEVAFGDREAVYEQFQPLVRRLLRQYGDSAETRKDLSGEIYYRFCALFDAFDPSRGVPFRPYMVRQLTAALYTYARNGWRRQKRELSLELNTAMCD